MRGFPEERELALRASVHWAMQVECRLRTGAIAAEPCVEKFEVAGQALRAKHPDQRVVETISLDRSPGVVVCWAPNEAGLIRLLVRLDRETLRGSSAAPLPLRGRKIHLAPGDPS